VDGRVDGGTEGVGVPVGVGVVLRISRMGEGSLDVVSSPSLTQIFRDLFILILVVCFCPSLWRVCLGLDFISFVPINSDRGEYRVQGHTR
jgi:hypothetical protein